MCLGRHQLELLPFDAVERTRHQREANYLINTVAEFADFSKLLSCHASPEFSVHPHLIALTLGVISLSTLNQLADVQLSPFLSRSLDEKQ